MRNDEVLQLDELTPSERRVLEMLASGLSNRGIARALHLSPRTVESHTKWIFRKLDLWPSEEQHRRVLAARGFILANETASGRSTSKPL
jgi:DNA-binding NarL/FixJ family response regulator